MATEYIEKKAAIDAVDSVPAADWVRKRYTGELERIPPADVRPVDVGLWLRVGNTGLASCRCGFITDRYSTYRYCPNCGRKNGGVEYGG